MPQIRPLADIVHFKYSHTYLLTYLLACYDKQHVSADLQPFSSYTSQ